MLIFSQDGAFRQSYGTSLYIDFHLLNKVEKSVAKREIAYYEQFLLLPHCFKLFFLPYMRQNLYVEEWFK